MCKHCNIEWDGSELIRAKSKPIKIGKLHVGTRQLISFLRRDDRRKCWTINLAADIVDTSFETGDDMDMRIKIKYCPFCGDKLADRFDKE